MNSAKYLFCNHPHLKRIDKNFVKCLDCGQSIVNQQVLQKNKSSYDFAKENEKIIKNFDRHFTNNFIDESMSDEQRFEYYTDRRGNGNSIKINRKIAYYSDPPQYEIIINSSKTYLPDIEISSILRSIDAIKIDEDTYNYISKHSL